jgi:hypothetical protein
MKSDKGGPSVFYRFFRKNKVEKIDASFKLCPLATNPKLQINVSLRGGTTKQSVSFRKIPFVKFIEIAQFMHYFFLF